MHTCFGNHHRHRRPCYLPLPILQCSQHWQLWMHSCNPCGCGRHYPFRGKPCYGLLLLHAEYKRHSSCVALLFPCTRSSKGISGLSSHAQHSRISRTAAALAQAGWKAEAKALLSAAKLCQQAAIVAGTGTLCTAVQVAKFPMGRRAPDFWRVAKFSSLRAA